MNHIELSSDIILLETIPVGDTPEVSKVVYQILEGTFPLQWCDHTYYDGPY